MHGTVSSNGRAADLGSVAIVHDYVNQFGGAERVVLDMARTFPGAPIHTALYRPDATFPEYRELDIRTSPLDRVPISDGFRLLAPLLPLAVRALGTIDADLVLSSSAGWAHGVRTSPRALHAVYCYTPARWLHGDVTWNGIGQPLMPAPLRQALVRWDRRAARRPDLYIAVSEVVRRRILACYGRHAPVVYPGADLERFAPSERGERLLVVSRLVPRKRVDLAVDAATRAGLGLDVVGTGPALDELRGRAGPTVTFHGALPDGDVTALYQSCRALLFTAIEDFGLTSVEAHAAGKPVVAIAAGGVQETVADGVNGVLFAEQTVESLLDGVRRSDDLATAPEEIAASAARFSRAAFSRRLTEVLAGARSGQPDQRAEAVGVR